jgi:hypothetical protein
MISGRLRRTSITTGPIPTFVSFGTAAGATTAITPGLPASILTGDILLYFTETANEAITVSGWTEVTNSPQGTGTAGSSNATRLTVFWVRYDSGSPPGTISSDSGQHQYAVILAFRGCVATGNPWNITAGTTAATSTAVSIPGATTTNANCLVVAAFSSHIATTVSLEANADLGTLTEQFDGNTAQGNAGGLAVYTGTKAVAGAYGATTATLASTAIQGLMTIALLPT